MDGAGRGKWRGASKLDRRSRQGRPPVGRTRLGEGRGVRWVDADGVICQGARAAGAVARTGALQLVHNPPDRAGAPPALRTAAETAIDLARHPRPIRAQHRPNLMVRQDVAGTDDHSARLPSGIDGGTTTGLLIEIMQMPFVCKRKRVFRSSIRSMYLLSAAHVYQDRYLSFQDVVRDG